MCDGYKKKRGKVIFIIFVKHDVIQNWISGKMTFCAIFFGTVTTVFFFSRSKLTSVMESIPKSKKNKRCNLHSLETHKTRTPGYVMYIVCLIIIKLCLSCPVKHLHTLNGAVNLSVYIRTSKLKYRFCVNHNYDMMLSWLLWSPFDTKS